MFVTLSGKMFAGKDTTADLLCARLPGSTYRFTFSDVLRETADQGVDAARRAGPGLPPAQVHAVSEAMDISTENAARFLALLSDDLKDPEFTTASRTEGVRDALQALGSTWKPRGYWSSRVLDRAILARRSNDNVLLVGTRFPDERDLFTLAGAFTVRLDISRDEQVRRALARDGLVPTDEQFTHPGETLLDDEEFNLRIDTSRRTPEQVVSLIITALNAARHSPIGSLN